MNTTTAPGITESRFSLATLLRELDHRDPWLTRSGLFLLALLIPSFIASLVDPRLFEGASTWIKPMKFQLSVGLYLLTAAWFMAYTRPAFQHSRRRSLLSGLLAAGALYEVLYISLQGSLAEASHFNNNDALHSLLYSLMGIGALLLTAMVGWQGVEVARHRQSGLTGVLRWSIAIGLVLTFVLSVIAGFTISTLDSPIVGMEKATITPLLGFGWATNAGDVRVAHFIGTHAMHLLPLAGWVLSKRRVPYAGFWLGAFSLSFLLGWWFVYQQALAGRPLLGM